MANKTINKTSINLIIAFCIVFLLVSCAPCSTENAVQEFKDTAWWGLSRPDTIWFPPEDEMNITSKGPIMGEYACDFIAYGKKFNGYRAFKVNLALKCTPQGMINVDNAAYLANSYAWDVTDSVLIKKLEQTPPSQFTHKKKSWEKKD